MDELWKNQMFATHAIAGVASVTSGTALTYPLDTIKVLIQVGSGSSKQLTAAQILERVRSLSGNSGLYSGFGWLALGRIFGVGARFGIYEILTAFYKDGREDNFVSVSEALMAGIAAGATESLISSPFELFKLREQVKSASHIPSSASVTEKRVVAPVIAKLLHGYSPDKKAFNSSVGLLSTLATKHPNMMSALQEYPWMITGSGRPPSVCYVRRPSDIISLEGWGALWRGIRPGVVRDSVFSGIFFSSWQFLHRAMLDWKAIGMDPPPRSDEEIGPLSPLAVSLAAGFSGSVAAAASHCFDTAKSRSQCVVLPKYISMERQLLNWRRPGNRFETDNPLPFESQEEITLSNNERAFWLNKDENASWRGQLPIDQYRLNVDPNPTVIVKKPKEKIQYRQEVHVKYLKPPTPKPSELIIVQEPNRQLPPAPPLIVRQPAARQPTPEPIIIREAPPQIPEPTRRVIHVPGKVVQAPARKVVVERLPCAPPKPQQVIIERWLKPRIPPPRIIVCKPCDQQQQQPQHPSCPPCPPCHQHQQQQQQQHCFQCPPGCEPAPQHQQQHHQQHNPCQPHHHHHHGERNDIVISIFIE